ncbi:MAG: threonylcarbamoyl-AMP synthase [Bacilli bacterium]|nr:threonylcarbamoyl-AMP synthase [Bacilli bacterium]
MIKFDPKINKEAALAKTALEEGGVVAFPTETVMGLGVVFNNRKAYDKLNKVKERPEDKPYTMMVANVEDISKYAIINEATQRVIDAFMPGSITILVNVKKNSVPSYVTHNTDIIGIRIPTNIEARVLLEMVNIPLLVPSANKSGSKPALNSDEVKEIFGSELDFVMSGKAKGEVPSTIVDLTKETPRVVRPGPISEEEIIRVWNNK